MQLKLCGGMTKKEEEEEEKERYQLGSFEVGQTKAHTEHGIGCTTISRKLFKADGKTTFSENAVYKAMCKLKEDPSWRGEREAGSGAERKTTKKQDKEIIKWVLAMRGTIKVTVKWIKKQFPYLRELSDSLVEVRMDEADLKYMRRNNKCLVTKKYLAARVKYCESLSGKHNTTLAKWAYTDGTVYYIDRDDAEHESLVRRALGKFVWRRSDNSDAMYQECIGPSAYNKAQGIPIRVWGMLADGVISIHVLNEGEVMEGFLYRELIEDKFEDWRGNCEHLVCDFERSLRTTEAIEALKRAGLTLVEHYPPVSQDFNAIENVWAILRTRLPYSLPNLHGQRRL